jgi:hexulose-6-phosphate isomerase
MIRKSTVRTHVPKETPLDQALSIIRDAGFHGVQLILGVTEGDVRLNMSEAEVRDVARLVKASGLKAHSFMPSTLGRLLDPNPAERDAAIGRFAQGLEIAARMGVRVMLVHPGAVSETCAYDKAMQWCTEAFRRLLPVAKKTRCCLAIENVWNRFLLSPLETCAFVDQFESDAVRCYFDVGNIILYGFAEQWVRILGRRIVEVHLKDFRRGVGTGYGFVPLLSGDVNWAAVMRELRAIRFDGFACAELGRYAHDPGYQSLRDASSAMDAILKMGKD